MSFVEPEYRPYAEAPAPAPSRRSAILQYVLMAIAAIYVIASLYLLYDLRTRLAAMEQKQHAMEQAMETAQAELNNRIHATSSEFKQALTTEVGLTKQEIAQRAAELERAQKASAAKLSAAQSQQGQQIAAVNTEVSGVKTEVGAAKTDIQKTQTDLAATNAKLAARHGRPGRAERTDCPQQQRTGDAEAQGRAQLLRLHAAEERAHAGLDHQPAAEEG